MGNQTQGGGGGGVLQISSDRDDQKKLFWGGLKFLIGLSDIL